MPLKKNVPKYRKLLDVTDADDLEPSDRVNWGQMIKYTRDEYKQLLCTGEWTPYNCSHASYKPDLPDACVVSGPVLPHTLAPTIQKTVAASVIQCMEDIYGTSF